MTGENINNDVIEDRWEKMTIDFELAHPMLCEMAHVYTDDNLNISIQVNRNEGRTGSYFKLYNHKEYRKASKVARIDFRNPEYIYHVHHDGKKDWALNSHERAKLLEILNMKIFHGETVWKMLILNFNLEGGLNYNESMKNKMKKLIYPNHLPIDLPIPDYTKLSSSQPKSQKLSKNQLSGLT